MACLILNDEIDYTSTFFPTHIISKDQELLHVFIGAANIMLKGFLGIYVKDEDYDKIRHDKAYIFIHDPDVKQDDVEKVEWDKITDVKDEKTVGREHIHIWR